MKNPMKTNFIFITGGVVSSLGKGIASASIGAILKTLGYTVNILKFDPYLNIDPGTMSPLQHGEVFVTSDGIETDLDLGHYERFLNQEMYKENNVTAGQIYNKILKNERKGVYLGKTVQVIPHITDEIKKRIKAIKKEITIVEIGGTVGDIESLPFIEAIRQMNLKYNCIYIHLTLIPYLKAAKEIKTKPTQHSVQKLRAFGIQPNILLCRTEQYLTKKIKEKISLFTNVSHIITGIDTKSIYDIPSILNSEGITKAILSELQLPIKKPNLSHWKKLSKIKYTQEVTVGIVGKYTELEESYKSIHESLIHAGMETNTKVNIKYISSIKVDFSQLKNIDRILIPGGFGNTGIEGKIKIIKYAREKKIPFLGICLGMQLAVIEYARSWGFDANSEEFDKDTPFPIIHLMQNQYDKKNKGATMRLGNWKCKLKKSSHIASIYKQKQIEERHRHRYEVNTKLFKKIKEMQDGLVISGKGKYIEVIELKDQWFIGVQYHPEFKSSPLQPHPLFISFIKGKLRF